VRARCAQGRPSYFSGRPIKEEGLRSTQAELGDNSASYDLVNKEGTSSKSRHFERATIMIKYAIMRLVVISYLVSTVFCVADVFTKATDADTFFKMRGVLRNLKTWDMGMRFHRMKRFWNYD
jgi:hypothetical protein